MKTSNSKEEVLWGLATTYYLQKKKKKALKLFKELTIKFPESLQYKFEYGTILINFDTKKALMIIQDVMNQTHQYDYFYKSIGDFWYLRKDYQKAIKSYTEYSKIFPDDVDAEKKTKKCFELLKGGK